MEHCADVDHVIHLLVLELIIVTCVGFRGLSHNQLAHFVDVKALRSIEQPDDSSGEHSLPMDKLTQVHLFLKLALRLLQLFLVIFVAKQVDNIKGHLFDRLDNQKLLCHALKKL